MASWHAGCVRGRQKLKHVKGRRNEATRHDWVHVRAGFDSRGKTPSCLSTRCVTRLTKGTCVGLQAAMPTALVGNRKQSTVMIESHVEGACGNSLDGTSRQFIPTRSVPCCATPDFGVDHGPGVSSGRSHPHVSPLLRMHSNACIKSITTPWLRFRNACVPLNTPRRSLGSRRRCPLCMSSSTSTRRPS